MIFLLLCCRTPSSFPTPIPRDVPWETVDPTAEQLERFDEAHAYSVENNGLSMVVIQGDEILFAAHVAPPR